ncbi:MAG TPA: carboxylating nicotinate-nucleotide diphosphorylase [Puia sp.]|uniref:carboxylating nicotinate-nucleotide diphosphorylase n=1 Tax=Puia sp. TaxID=2045100 RepID=UPI002CB673B7|nr:carboxylating nicotinate-nucleotide diphosphorylase [Puia sp.]HVU99016.1 carboxylating nicotinate-nucleotide diphosphorylase [Puia sp.]
MPNLFDEQLQFLVTNALKEDIGSGDHTTLSCIPPDARGKAVLHIKQDGILAGMEIAEKILKIKEPGAKFTPYKQDGDGMRDGEEAFIAEATVHTILQCERLILNCMQRMSGIATLTRQYVDRLQRYKTRVIDTRKTTPNFRLLEKEAVRIGGGINNRFGLYDMILLKDNHIDYAGGIEAAIEKASAYRQAHKLHLKIEVETRNLDEVKRVLAVGKVDRIMLDNFTPRQLAEALSLIGERFETEASGGINLNNIEDFARTGVDYVSVGALIHQARSLDLSLKAVIL